MKIKNLLIATMASAVAIGGSMTASATSLVRLDLNAMATESASVVVGTVVEQHSADTAQGLYTMTTFNVSDSVVGDSGSTVTVATPGGIRTNGKFKIAETWPGAPQFLRGQEVLMFLTADDAGIGNQVVGFSQGVLPVMETAAGKSVRMPDASGRVVSLSEAKNQILRARAGKAESRKVAD